MMATGWNLRKSALLFMKRGLSIGVLLQTVTGLMTLTLAIIFAVHAITALESEQHARRVPVIVGISKDLFAAVQNLRVERGQVNTSLATQDVIDPDTQNEIARLRVQSGKALDSALARLANVGVAETGQTVGEIRQYRDALAGLRHDIDVALTQPKDRRPIQLDPDWIKANGELIAAIDHLSGRLEDELSRDDAFIANIIHLKQLIWAVRFDSGNDRLLVREATVESGKLSEEKLRQFAILEGRIEGTWKLVKDEAQSGLTPPTLKEAVAAADRLYFVGFLPKRNAVIAALAAGKPVRLAPREWLQLSGPGRQSMFKVVNVAFDLASTRAAEQFGAAQRNFYIATSLMIVFLAIGALTALYVRRGVTGPITRITETMGLVANGDLACEIPYEHRGDEIGLLSRALRVFRDNAIERQSLHVAKLGAEASNRAKSDFLANMSHELRTPLNAIIGFSEIIKGGMFGAVTERYRSYAGDIFNSGTHLLELINEILDLSKLDAGQLTLHEENVDVGAQVRTCMRLLQPQAEKSKIQLTASIGDATPLIRADDRRLRQILLNLLSNAVKFTPEGGKVRVTVSHTDAGLEIGVRDTGIGMASEEIPKALEPFGQIDSKLSRKYEGTGLGLPLVKRLVDLHGGTLVIESKVNVGTLVTILLPPERILSKSARLRAGGQAVA
jgi:signal transduction histidine kinase